MYDDVAKLIAYGTPTYDKYGNEIETLIEKDVFVQPRSVYQSEFYNAAQHGLKPSITFFISNRADYDDEKIVEYNGKTYQVIRVDWKAQRDGINLVCEERADVGEHRDTTEQDSE